ncbi:MAG: AarF/UbiB family protein [Candidatus Peribacteraceae bacterium]|nr:AarF/UbiB family protein [Candidatus Peribacteraceae bacterium]
MHKHLFLTLRRTAHIALRMGIVLMRIFLFRHKKHRQAHAVRLRRAIERLGSVFIKFAQLLALRPDMLPSEYCHEMLHLLDAAPPVAIHTIEKMFEEQFPVGIKEAFASFDPHPLAAASMGQVHRATLKSGTEVVVKFLRPNLETIMRRDLKILRFVASCYDVLTLWSINLAAMVDEVRAWTDEELDFRNEAASMTIFLKHIAGDPVANRVPRVFTEWSSRRVITMEFIDGFSMNRYMKAVRTKDKDFLKTVSKTRFSTHDVAIRLFRECCKYVYLKGVFHGDLHPGNVIYCPKEDAIYYIDFGIIGTLTDSQRLQCLRYARSSLCGDTSDAFDALMKMLDMSHIRHLSKLRECHDRILAGIFAPESAGIADPDTPQRIGTWLSQTMSLLQKYRVKIPFYLIKYFRALAVFESTVFEIFPDLSIREMERKMRNISIVNILNHFSELLEGEPLNAMLLRGVNAIEDYLYKGNQSSPAEQPSPVALAGKLQ